MKRISCKITGRVQMVMYRDFAARTAKKLGIHGVVRNETDGSVTVVAEGEEQKLNEYVAALQKGSLLSAVEGVDVSWGEPTAEFGDFSIDY